MAREVSAQGDEAADTQQHELLQQRSSAHPQQQPAQHADAAPAAEPMQQPQQPSTEPQADKQHKRKKKKQNKLLSQEKLRRLKEQHDRRGIIYISRLPPHMKPAKLRQLLSQYGEVGRIYCTPEDPAARQMRKRKGGNSGKNFTEGWVEFEDKADAKSVAAGLNGQQIGGRRRSAYHFDLWCMKYLPKFKWDHLTEEIAYEKAVREQRMAQELAAAKRERDFYLSRVDRAKALDAMQLRRQAKQQQPPQAGDASAGGGGAAAAAAGGGDGAGEQQQGSARDPSARPAAGAAAARVKRSYGQRKAKPDPAQPGAAGGIADDVLGLLVAPKAAKKQRS